MAKELNWHLCTFTLDLMKFYSDQHWYQITMTTCTTTVNSYDVMSSHVACTYHLSIWLRLGMDTCRISLNHEFYPCHQISMEPTKVNVVRSRIFRTLKETNILLEFGTCPMLFWTAQKVHLNTETCHDLLLWFRMWATCKITFYGIYDH